MTSPTVHAESLATDAPGTRPYELTRVSYDLHTLSVQVESANIRLRVSFNAPTGFRVLDEGDLLEFWPACSSNNGWLYEITQGGWLAFEAGRNGFLSNQVKGLREFFVAGENECVSVFALEEPLVLED